MPETTIFHHVILNKLVTVTDTSDTDVQGKFRELLNYFRQMVLWTYYIMQTDGVSFTTIHVYGLIGCVRSLDKRNCILFCYFWRSIQLNLKCYDRIFERK
jgi:hypothetical protein